MINLNFPKCSNLAEWALKNAKLSYDFIEFEGNQYRITYRHFSGNIGKKLASINSELKTGTLYLINTELHQVFIEKTGKYVNDFGNFGVCEVIYEIVLK